MIRIFIPGRAPLYIEHVVCDMNGTLSVDGTVSDAVREKLRELANHLEIHVITANTFGTAGEQFKGVPLQLQIIKGAATRTKAEFVRRLGAASCAALGNGRNDEEMLQVAGLSIVVLGREGAAVPTLCAADIAVRSPEDAVDLLLNPKRIVATLRA